MKKNIMIDNWKNIHDNKNCVKPNSESFALYQGSRKAKYIKCLQMLHQDATFLQECNPSSMANLVQW